MLQRVFTRYNAPHITLCIAPCPNTVRLTAMLLLSSGCVVCRPQRLKGGDSPGSHGAPTCELNSGPATATNMHECLAYAYRSAGFRHAFAPPDPGLTVLWSVSSLEGQQLLYTKQDELPLFRPTRATLLCRLIALIHWSFSSRAPSEKETLPHISSLELRAQAKHRIMAVGISANNIRTLLKCGNHPG